MTVEKRNMLNRLREYYKSHPKEAEKYLSQRANDTVGAVVIKAPSKLDKHNSIK